MPPRKKAAKDKVDQGQAEEKNKGGRPSLYEPKFCRMLIDHMREGLSYKAFGAVAKVSKQTLYDWEDAHPEWKHAKELASCELENFYVRMGLDLARGQYEHGNASAWKFLTKNLLKWREHYDVQVANPNGEPLVVETVRRMTPEQRKEKLEKLRARRLEVKRS